MKLKKIYLWPAALAVIFMSSIIIIASPVGDKTFIPLSQNSDTVEVKIYQSPTDVSESCESVDFIEVDIPKSATPLKDSLNYLISYLDNSNGFRLVSATIKDSVATLTFDDPNFFTSGGSCWSGILSSQVEKTALQFSGVKSVKFAGPEWLFQP
jgi:hypothetical protein